VRTEVAAPPPGPGPEEPEAPNRGRRVTVLVLVLSAVMATLWVAGPYIFAGRDDPTAIDSKPVRTTVQKGCTQLRADLAALPAGMAAGDRAEAQNRAVEQFVGKVRALGPDALTHDHPVEAWLSDWELLVATRRQAVRDGTRFTPPMGDMGPVNVRMFALIRSGLEKCDVPEQLLAPEPGRA
jgi:hypothetical protein